MIIRAREIVPGAVWAWSVPIRPGETGQLVRHEACKCLEGACGGLRWQWNPWLNLVPPKGDEDNRNWIETFRYRPARPWLDEYSRIDLPAK